MNTYAELPDIILFFLSSLSLGFVWYGYVKPTINKMLNREED